MGQRMDRAEALLERRRAHRRRAHQVAAGLDVVGVRHDLRQVLEDEPHALDRDAVGDRVIAGRAIGLEAMRQGVEPGADGDERAACRP